MQTILYHHPNLQHSKVGPTERNNCLFFKLETPQYTGRKTGNDKTADFKIICHHKVDWPHLYSRTKTLHCGLQLFLSSKIDFANSCLLIEINSSWIHHCHRPFSPLWLIWHPSPTTTPSEWQMNSLPAHPPLYYYHQHDWCHTSYWNITHQHKK